MVTGNLNRRCITVYPTTGTTSEETLIHRVGPKRLALVVAAGTASVTASPILFVDAMLMTIVTLVFALFGLVFIYVVLSRLFQRELDV